MKRTIYIIGSGFASLSASCYLAQAGHEVIILEKNSTIGGRARQYKKDGFIFDIGPTWYWMPDVFERFFSDFNKIPLDYYRLDQLNPAYEVYFSEQDSKTISGNLEEIYTMFENEEPGSSPKGGMYKVIEGTVTLAKSLGVQFQTNANVEEIVVEKNAVKGIKVNGNYIETDLLLSGADYHHTETLLPKENRQYSEAYWEKKTFAPSALLFYVALDRPIENVSHHTLFFDCDFEKHAETIYDDPSWPEDPLFYASFPSKTDTSLAPEGKEAATFLIPLAPGISDTMETRELYFNKIIERLEKVTNQKVKNRILFKKSFCVNDFIEDYNSYKGNAYGLANTLFQTAFLRPKIKSKKVENLFFTGQLTVPGPGVPPALISGKIAATLMLNKLKP